MQRSALLWAPEDHSKTPASQQRMAREALVPHGRGDFPSDHECRNGSPVNRLWAALARRRIWALLTEKGCAGPLFWSSLAALKARIAPTGFRAVPDLVEQRQFQSCTSEVVLQKQSKTTIRLRVAFAALS